MINELYWYVYAKYTSIMTPFMIHIHSYMREWKKVSQFCVVLEKSHFRVCGWRMNGKFLANYLRHHNFFLLQLFVASIKYFFRTQLKNNFFIAICHWYPASNLLFTERVSFTRCIYLFSSTAHMNWTKIVRIKTKSFIVILFFFTAFIYEYKKFFR